MEATFWEIIDTNYGPLTTTFTPSADCLSLLHAKTLDRGGYLYDALGGGDGLCSKAGNGRPDVYAYHYNDNCYPTTLPSPKIGYFSPGLVCPSQWTQVASSTLSIGQIEGICCPSHFTYESSGNCFLSSSQELSISAIVYCPSPSGDDFKSTYTTSPGTVSRDTTTGGRVIHPAVRLRREDANHANTQSDSGDQATSTASLTLANPSATSSQSSANSATPNSAAAKTKRALSMMISLAVYGALIAL